MVPKYKYRSEHNKIRNTMTKMRKYTFIDPSLPEGEDTKVIESLGYKKAVKSYQVSSKAPMVNVYWTSKWIYFLFNSISCYNILV